MEHNTVQHSPPEPKEPKSREERLRALLGSQASNEDPVRPVRKEIDFVPTRIRAGVAN